MSETTTVVSPVFKIALATVILITFVSFATLIAFAAFDPDSQAAVLDTCDFAFKAGLGAILGLVGGKTT